MLRARVICPDVELNGRLDASLSDIGGITVTRVMERYPNQQELIRFLRAHAPQVVFLSTDSLTRAGDIVREIEKHTPGVQVIAMGRACDPQLLLELMRAGIREYATDPFDRAVLGEALQRVREMLEARPAFIESTDNVFSFLPSKAGVGASTVALNAAVAMSRQQNMSVLLSDFD